MKAKDAGRIPAFVRLRELPPVFDLRDVAVAFDWDANQSRVFCTRAVDQGLARRSGPRTGIYYNLVVDPEAHQRRIGEALQKCMPSTVIIGSSALHAGEWTTQRPHVLEVAVPRTRALRTFPKFDGVHIVFRDRYWYEAVAKELKSDPLQRSLRTLGPAAALADAWVNGDVWNPDPDDIQVEDAESLEVLRDWLLKLGMREAEADMRVKILERMHWGGLDSAWQEQDDDWDDPEPGIAQSL